MAADVAERDATSGGMRLSRGLSLGASRDQIPHPTHGGRLAWVALPSTIPLANHVANLELPTQVRGSTVPRRDWSGAVSYFTQLFRHPT